MAKSSLNQQRLQKIAMPQC